jgi:hypothetical protein
MDNGERIDGIKTDILKALDLISRECLLKKIVISSVVSRVVEYLREFS